MTSRDDNVSSSGEQESRFSACWSDFNNTLVDFHKFVWNRENKTVLGRDGKSWGKILLFYLVYYGFLAAIFAVAMVIMLGSLNSDVPRFQSRLQTPGVTIQPRLPPEISTTSDIRFSFQNNVSFQGYVDQMRRFLSQYDNQADTAIFKNCTNGKVISGRDSNNGTVCLFDPMLLGPCAVYPYGYFQGEPCVLVKVNKIINWYPVAFANLSEEAARISASRAPTLSSVLAVNNIQYNPYIMYIACYGLSEADQRNLNGNVGVSPNTKYFPRSNGIPFKYYPYLGKQRQQNYKTPVLAVQFTNVTKNVEIHVGCKAYAKNIVSETARQAGFYTFRLRITG